MNADRIAALAKEMWRPFTGYGGAVALIVSLFNPAVTPEKMLVIASLVGGLGWMRSQDKKLPAQG